MKNSNYVLFSVNDGSPDWAFTRDAVFIASKEEFDRYRSEDVKLADTSCDVNFRFYNSSTRIAQDTEKNILKECVAEYYRFSLGGSEDNLNKIVFKGYAPLNGTVDVTCDVEVNFDKEGNLYENYIYKCSSILKKDGSENVQEVFSGEYSVSLMMKYITAADPLRDFIEHGIKSQIVDRYLMQGYQVDNFELSFK